MSSRRRSPLRTGPSNASHADGAGSSDLERLSVVELRSRLESKNLATTGRRPALLKRLREAEEEDEPVTLRSVRALISEAVSSAVSAMAATESTARPADPPLLSADPVTVNNGHGNGAPVLPCQVSAGPDTSVTRIATARGQLPLSGPTSSSSGTSGMPIVPLRLRDRITRGEYIDLDELLPECIGSDSDSVLHLSVGAGQSVQLVQKAAHKRAPVAKRHIHDIATWVEAFTTYTRILVDAAPVKAGDLLAYQATIIEANSTYMTNGWLTYDRRFRLALASMPHLYSWRIIDPNLWQSCLTSQGRPVCSRCSIVHPVATAICPFRGGLPSSPTTAGSQFTGPQPRHNGKVICRNYNNASCTYSPCSRIHVCLRCRGKHPAKTCTKGTSTSSQ